MSSGGSAPGPASRFDRVNSIVEAAAELRPEERAPFVEGLCGGDPEMRDSVLRLLSVFGRMGDFMEKRARRGAELRAGDVLAGRFRIVEKLGEGGMGSVYLAEDRELGEVALKTIRADLRENAEVIERFRSEIKLARGIGHRNVCPVFELFPNEETAAGPVTFFTMKYLKGETLANRLARGRMELDEALRVARGIAAGLDALHSDGIVHRDLKPGNVILTPEPDGPDRPVITDFGLARTASGAADGAVTGAARLMGSPDYMAPEQFLNATVGKAADVYAFGSIVFEMAAGARPFPKEDLLHAAVRRASEDAPRLSSVAKGVPGWLDAAVARSLRREVGERAGSAGEVVRGPVERGVSRRTLVGAAGGAIVLSGIYAARRYMDRAVPLPESPKMMLTACAHLPGEKDREIAATVDTLLRTQLQQSAHVSLLDAGSVERALGRMQAGSGQKKSLDDAKTAREAAMREGAAYVLFGDLGRKADVYNVGLRLELLGASPEREREHWDFEASAREDELRELPARIDRAVYEIRRKVGESQKDWEVHNRTPSELTTGSWEALQLYVRGEESWAAARRVEAVDFVKAAIDLDAEFILALGRLADYRMALGDVDQAIEAHTKAAALVEKKHLTDPESLGILGMYALDTCQFEKAATVYKRFRQQYPENPFPYFYEADAVRRLGQPEYSNSLIRQAIRLGPGYFGFRNGLCLNLLKDGSLDTAAEENERSRSLAASGWADRMAAAIAFSRLRMADVEAALKSMERKPEAEFQSMALQLTACLRADQGRLTEAETLLRRGRDFAVSENLPQSHVFDFESLLVEVLRLTKRLPDAVALCRKMLARSTGMQETMRTGCLLARCGAVAEAAGCSVAAPDLPVYGHWACRLRGEIALARGDAANGLMWMSRTPEYAIPIWPEYLVRAALAAGQTQIAADQVNRLAANPGPYWFQANHAPPGFIRWAAELARSERLAGVNTGAIARLYEFLT